MNAPDRRLPKLFRGVTLLVAAVVVLGIVSFVIALVLINTGDHSTGITTVTTTP